MMDGSSSLLPVLLLHSSVMVVFVYRGELVWLCIIVLTSRGGWNELSLQDLTVLPT
jgi:hypothetical protein